MIVKKNINTLRTSGILIGIGMGGFVDGILFHQIFQIHNMLSNRYFPDTLVNADINMFWDGLFHAFTWSVTAFGILMLWKAGKRPDAPWLKNLFVGAMFLGWGLFNLIEGIIDHEILQVHHVVQRATGAIQIFWDMAFLAFGIVLIIFGRMLMNKGAPDNLNS